MSHPTTTLQSLCEFADETYAYFDPTTVTCAVTDPSANAATYTYGVSPNLTKTSTGHYKCLFDADEAGVWEVVWYGATSGGKITVQKTYKVPALV